MHKENTEITDVNLDYLEEIPELALDVIADTIKNSFKEIKGTASSLASEDHGFLKRSINFKIKKYKKDKTVWGTIGVEHKKFIDPETGDVINPALYGRFIEYGTTKITAKPFMRPAVERIGNDEIDKRISKATQELVKVVCEKNNKNEKKI